MEVIESLLFGIEPLTALAVGVSAVLLAPVIGAAGSAISQSGESGEAASNPVTQMVDTAGSTTREWVKGAVVWGMEVAEGVQTAVAEAGESLQDFVAEAKAEYEAKKAEQQTAQTSTQPRVVEIVE